MSNSYTTRLKKRLPTVGDSNWDDEWHDNEKLDDVVAGALLSINRIVAGGAVTDGGGLTADTEAAIVRIAGVQGIVGSGSATMAPEQINWIYINSSGSVVVSSTPPSGDYIPLAMVDTNSTSILRIADLRPIVEGVSAVPTAADIGKVLMAKQDLSLAYQPANLGRKNSIINGNFDIWQRATSQTSSGYGSDDRWLNENTGTTKNHSRQVFTLGQTLVPGNPRFFSRTVVTSVAGVGNFARKTQRIERVTTNAGGQVTCSFFFDTNIARNIAVAFIQNFGTGGSPSAEVIIGAQLVAVTPGFKKYSITVNLPSVAGKTLGTNGNDHLALVFWYDAGSSFDAQTSSLGQQSGTFDLAQVQIERGETATEFERITYADELWLCQRYYEKKPGSMFTALSDGAGGYKTVVPFIVEKRTLAPVITATVNTGTFSLTYSSSAILFWGLSANAFITSCSADDEL